MRKLFVFFLLLPFLGSAKDNPADLFKAANAAYTKGKFDVALKNYQQLLDSGYQSKVVYYNLGNANYRLDNFAAAILNYEKAYKLAPGDEDIQMNLRLANLKITDKIETVPEFFLQKWWTAFITSLSLQTWSAMGAALFLFGFVLLIVYLFSMELNIKRASFYSGVVLILLASMCLGIAAAQDSYFNTHKEAIVFNGIVNVKSAPDAKEKTLVVIHEGTKVQLMDSQNEWLKVRLPNGNVGWIEEEAIKKI